MKEEGGLNVLPLLPLTAGEMLAAVVPDPSTLGVPPGANEEVERRDGVGSAEAVSIDGEALELVEVDSEEVKVGVTELLAECVEESDRVEVGETL